MSVGFWWYGGAGEAQLQSATGHTIAVGQVAEIDVAQAILVAPKRRLVNQVTETDLAQAITLVKTRLLGRVTETDLAQPISWSPKNRLVAQVIETDFAQAITALLGGAGPPVSDWLMRVRRRLRR